MSKLIVAREIFATLSWILLPATIFFPDWLLLFLKKKFFLVFLPERFYVLSNSKYLRFIPAHWGFYNIIKGQING